MDVTEATDLIWSNRKYKTTSEKEVVSHLNEEVAGCLNALLRGDRAAAQAELEDALSCLLIAFKTMGTDPEKAIYRQLEKMKQQPGRVMYIYQDKVEIRVNNEVKGGWSIWSAEDLKDAEKMAREFNCEVIRVGKEDDSRQLTLEIPGK
ncbi:MAG: hypothetical protein GX568_02395 [Candidatus Gastranaerophilales bacterium]|nr:hypothetical protein [Candidatus Gastranaerophilales bacterium]